MSASLSMVVDPSRMKVIVSQDDGRDPLTRTRNVAPDIGSPIEASWMGSDRMWASYRSIEAPST
jgi:hypothetical protein